MLLFFLYYIFRHHFPEASKCLSQRDMDQAGRNMKSHIFRHCLNSDHETVNIEYFKILNMGYNNNTYAIKREYLTHYL